MNAQIDTATSEAIKMVKGAEHMGIMTCAIIDSEFVLCSDYDIDDEMEAKLKNAASAQGSFLGQPLSFSHMDDELAVYK